MLTIISRFGLLWVLFLSFSCSENDAEEKSVDDHLSLIDLERAGGALLSDLAKNVEIVVLSDKAEAYFSVPFQSFVTSKNIFVLDRKFRKVFAFSKISGELLYSLDGAGGGEGSFSLPQQISVHEDTLVLYTGVEKKLLYFDAESGNFLSEQRLDPNRFVSDFSLISDLIVTVADFDLTPQNTGVLTVQDRNTLEVISTNLAIDKDISPMINPQLSMTKRPVNGRILYKSPIEDEVFGIDDAGDVSKEFRIAIPEFRKVPEEVYGLPDYEFIEAIRKYEEAFVTSHLPLESEDYFSVDFVKNMSFNNGFIFNKKNGSVLRISDIENDLFEKTLTSPVELLEDNTFVFAYEPDQLQSIEIDSAHQELLKLKQLKLTDNWVYIFIQFKTVK